MFLGVTPIGGRPIHSPYYSPRKATNIRLNPLNNKPNYGFDVDTFDEKELRAQLSSPLLTTSTKSHYNSDLALPLSPTPLSNKVLEPVPEAVSESIDLINSPEIDKEIDLGPDTPQSVNHKNKSSSDDETAKSMKKLKYAVAVLHNGINSSEDHPIRLSPPLVNGDDASSAVGKVIDFQSLVDTIPDHQKKELVNLQVPEQQQLVGKRPKSSAAAMVVPALRSEHLSLRQRHSGSTKSSKKVTVPDKNQSNLTSTVNDPSMRNYKELHPRASNALHELNTEQPKSSKESNNLPASTKTNNSTFVFHSSQSTVDNSYKNKPVVATTDNTTSSAHMMSKPDQSNFEANSFRSNKVEESCLSNDENLSTQSRQGIGTKSFNDSEEFLDPEVVVKPSSLKLFVPEQDDAVQITINLNENDDKNKKKIISEPTPDKVKPKKSISARAAEATSRLYATPAGREVKGDPKKNAKNLKSNFKKHSPTKATSRKVEQTASSKNSGAPVRNKVLSAGPIKKKMNSDIVNETSVRSKTKNASHNAKRQMSEDRVTVRALTESITSEHSGALTKETDIVETGNKPKRNSDIIQTQNDKTSEVSETVTFLNKEKIPNGGATLSDQKVPVSSKAKHYNQPIQTPIIVEAYPSPEENALLQKVALAKHPVLTTARSNSAVERKKKKNPKRSSTPLRSAKKNKKKQKEADFSDVTHMIDRAKSAGLVVEKRGKKGGKKERKKNYEKEGEEDLISDFDADKLALISGLSWQITVPKNDSGSHLIMKPIDSHSDAQFHSLQVNYESGLKEGKLSPIAEVRSVRSSQSHALEDEIDHATLPSNHNSNNNNNAQNDVQKVKLAENGLFEESQAVRRPDSSISTLQLNLIPTEDNIISSSPSQSKILAETAWGDESKTINPETASFLSTPSKQSSAFDRGNVGLPMMESVIGQVGFEGGDDEKSLTTTLETVTGSENEGSDESESEDELESYLRKLQQPRSEMDARILRRPSSSSESESESLNSTLNASTLTSQGIDGSVTPTNNPDHSVFDNHPFPPFIISKTSAMEFSEEDDQQSGVKSIQDLVNKSIQLDHSDHQIDFPVEADPSFVSHPFTSGESLEMSNDSESEMFENLLQTLHAQDADDSEESRSDCSIPFGKCGWCSSC